MLLVLLSPRLTQIMLIALVKNDSKSDVTPQQNLGGLLGHSPGTGTLQSNPGMKLHFVEQKWCLQEGPMLVFERAERRSSRQSSTHTCMCGVT